MNHRVLIFALLSALLVADLSAAALKRPKPKQRTQLGVALLAGLEEICPKVVDEGC